MHIKLFEISFLILGILSFLELIVLELGILKKFPPMKASDIMSAFAATLLLYVINSLILFFFVSGISRIYMLLFGLTPFIIGYFAKYKALRIFTFIQILIFICGIIYTINLLNTAGV